MDLNTLLSGMEPTWRPDTGAEIRMGAEARERGWSVSHWRRMGGSLVVVGIKNAPFEEVEVGSWPFDGFLPEEGAEYELEVADLVDGRYPTTDAEADQADEHWALVRVK